VAWERLGGIPRENCRRDTRLQNRQTAMCDECNDGRHQRMLWRKLNGEDVFTGIIMISNEGLEPDEWSNLGYSQSIFRLADPNDIEGARVPIGTDEFLEAMRVYD